MLGMYADREDKLTVALQIFRQLSPEQQVEIVALLTAADLAGPPPGGNRVI